MYIIDKATQALVVILIVLLTLFAAAAVWYIWKKKKRKNAKQSDMGVDYHKLERRNALDYVKLEDIRDSMILTENGTRFIAVIRCQGFDFFYAHVAEQYAAQSGYRGFLNTVNSPITYRQYTKSVDLEHINHNYTEAFLKLQQRLFYLSEDYKSAKHRLQEKENELRENGKREEEVQTEMEYMLDHLLGMQKEIEALEWRMLHVRDQMAYIEQLGKRSGTPVSLETYVMDWIYNPMDFPVELTKEEIMEKAKDELDRITRQKIHALSTAGVKAYRCTTDELIDKVRRHFQPISSDRYKMRDIKNNSYSSDIISMEGKEFLKSKYNEELAMEIIQAVNKEFEGAPGNGKMEAAPHFNKMGDGINEG